MQRSVTRSIHEHERFLERFLEGFGSDFVELALLVNTNKQLVSSTGNTRSNDFDNLLDSTEIGTLFLD